MDETPLNLSTLATTPPREGRSHRARELRMLGEEARTVADSMKDEGARRMMENLARTYERLAKHADDREVV